MANNSIVLKENRNLITDTQELANLLNTCYINLINTLQLKKLPTKFKSLSEILSFYKNHDSISKIKAGNNLQQQFHFKGVSSNEVKKIKSLNTKKSALSSCIPVSILINSIDTYLPILTDIINDSIKNGVFPDELKLAEVIPLFKKADPFDKSNYRPVSLLSHMSKVFERIIYNQINVNQYIEPFLPNLLTGFRKNHNTQYSLLKMLQSFKEALDKGNSVSAMFMDLSKAFDTLNHDLLMAKVEAYGFSVNSLSYIHSYLNKRLQKTNVNNNCSLWKEIFTGVPQGSILGPLLFNIYINDIFLFVDEAFLSNYADDTVLYSIHKNHISNQSVLKQHFICLQKLFYENYMVLNPGKCCYMTFGSKFNNNDLLEDGTTIPSVEEHVVLGITIDSHLNFYSHLKQLCKKVVNKLNALTRIASHLDQDQKKLIYNSFFTGQLSYCPLIWTYCSRQSNHLINRLQERALRITYNDYDSSFPELFEMSNESTVHIRNIKVLMTEIYKFLNDLSPPIMSDIFEKHEDHYSLRNPRSLASKQKLTTTYRIDTIAFRGPQIWHSLPPDIKNSESLNSFKSNIKRYGNLTCHCKICRTFVPCVGYIDFFLFTKPLDFCNYLVDLN